MSFEEYKKSPVYKATNILGRILNKKNIDWDLFDRELSKLPDINVIYEEDTILSELYHECPDGTILVIFFYSKSYPIQIFLRQFI